jgi:aldose 1-epimerase
MAGAASQLERSALLRSPHGELEATFLPQAGMLGWSLRDRGDELLGRPVSVETYIETGFPTGIPLLHPWANRLASPEFEVAGCRARLDLSAPHVHTDPAGLPIHGLLAGSPHWEVIEQGPARLSARLDFGERRELVEAFPFPHRLWLTAELAGRRLQIETKLVPTGDVPVPVAFGFHPYLRVPSAPRERWWLELPVTSRMRLDGRMLPTGESEPVRIAPGPLGDRTFDDSFDGLADPPEFAISGGGRRVFLRLGEGYRFAHVYAPPSSDYVSFEPMTAPINPFESQRTRLVSPGSAFWARFEIGVADRAGE